MLVRFCTLLLASLAYATPVIEVRTVTSLNQAAFEEAQQRDNTATRAFSSIEIKTSDGRCLFVDELSGDFRANLNPIQVAPCNGSTGQLWDVITKGKHLDPSSTGLMLVVNTLTQACMNFDLRRLQPVIMFSCGGRADGSGDFTPSQEFTFNGSAPAGTLPLEPFHNAGDTANCFVVPANNTLGFAPCVAGDPTQSFTFGSGGSAVVGINSSSITTTSAVESASLPAVVETSPSAASSSGCVSTTLVTVTRFIDTTSPKPTNKLPITSSVGIRSSPVVASNPATPTSV